MLTLGYWAEPQALPAPYADAGLTMAGLRIRVIYLIGLGLAVACVAGLHLALKRTGSGSRCAPPPRTR